MSLLTTVAKYGTKLVGGALKGLKFGQKAAGEVHKYGEKAKHAASVAQSLGLGGEKLSKAVGVVGNVTEAILLRSNIQTTDPCIYIFLFKSKKKNTKTK